MTENITQVIVAIIVTLGGFLTARYAKRDDTDDEKHKAQNLTVLEDRIVELEAALEACRRERDEDKAMYFDALSVLIRKHGARKTKRPLR